MKRTWRLALPAVLASLALGCYTRAEIEHPPPAPLIFRVLPYPTYDGDEGLAGHLVAGWRSSPNRRPPPVGMGLILDARISTSGTRGAVITFDAPARWQRWRALGVLGAERLQRVPFYGFGNSPPVADTFPTRYYRYALLRYTALGTVQRQLVGPVRLHLAGQWRHYRARSLGDSTLLRQMIAAGQYSDTTSEDDVELRVGLLFDTRDEEASPSRGVFLEAMAAHSVSGFDYTRYLLSAREFIHFGSLEQWVIGLRQTVELAEGTVPVYVAYERLTTWYPEDGFGGPTSLRIYSIGRFVAPNRSVVSVDLRRKMLDAPFPTAPVRIWVLGFVDVGKLWNVGVDPTLTDLHWSTGIGARLQLGKGVLFGLDVGRNDESFGLAVGTAFAF